MKFNASGNHFLITNTFLKQLLVLETESFLQKDEWTKPECEMIGRSRWIDWNIILAGFGGPGMLVAFLIGKGDPLLVISPKEIASSYFFDLEVSLDTKHAFGCTDQMVFMVDILNNSPIV
jgi:hypothetical protein